jgi:siroheme synthase-like protein
MTEQLAVYPASLLLRGRPVLVVGGGPVALRKVEGLLAAGALVTVVAPDVCAGIEALAGAGEAGGVRVERRRYRRGEVARYRLALTATGLPEVDRALFEDGERVGVFVNAADDPAGCSFHVPAVVRRGAVTIAISTGGTSPALAAWLRARIEDAVGPEYELVAEVLGSTRAEARRQGVPTGTLDWDDLISRLLGAPAGGPAATAASWLAGS